MKKFSYSMIILVTFLFIIVGIYYTTKNADLSLPATRDPLDVLGTSHVVPVVTASTSQYIEIIDSCDSYFMKEECVNMRTGPGMVYPVYARLRTGVVLKVGGIEIVDSKEWYRIIFAKELLYPQRVTGMLYIASGDSVQPFNNVGDEYHTKGATTTKRIIIDVSEQTIYAYDGNELFMRELISTGLEFTPTPRGTFTVFKKTPSRYMQGPVPGVSSQIYDLPGVPWDLYFTQDGAVIHGAYWHDHFGKPWSHGCVNLSPVLAKKLYEWTDPGTPVIVKN